MSPAELEVLLRKILGEGTRLHASVYLLLVAVSVFGAGVGAYVGAYLKRRAENLATKADFDALLEQLRTQTREVEEIRTEIANAGWIHQRRWDLKRELYWHLLEILEEIKQKGRWFANALQKSSWTTPETEQLVGAFAKHMVERGAIERLLSYKGVAGMILTNDAVKALDRLSADYNEVATLLTHAEHSGDHAWIVRDRIDSLLRVTEETYALVLAASQAELLASAGAA